MKACLLILLLLGNALPGVASDAAEDPLLSPTMVLCLRPIRMAQQPGLREAVETVNRLDTFSKSQSGRNKKAVDALVIIFRDLFQKEEELIEAEGALAVAERLAGAKDDLAAHEETVGSPLSGPNPGLAKMIRKEGAEIRGKATRRRDEALKLMKEKVTAYNMSVGYFQNQGNTEVVVALASSLFAVVDRHMPTFDFKPAVSREWVEKQKREDT